MISSRLIELVRCPDCGRPLSGSPPDLVCTGCSRRYPAGPGYLPLHPGVTYAEQTKYLDEALHGDARHEHVSPPLLSAKIRNDMLRRFLAPGPADTLIDLGCGSGRALVWNADLGAWQVGIDVSPFFAQEAEADVDLVLGDLRKLPFADGAFTAAWALDVMEHLSREALGDVLQEAARVLAPGGRLFLYSHVRRNAWPAAGLKAVNRFARWLERRGLVDLSRERLRKSDHLNPVADVPDLEGVLGAAGFRIARIRYYSPIFGAVVENVLMRMAEHAMSRRAADRAARESAGGDAAAAHDGDRAAREARTIAKRRISRRGPLYAALVAVTWVMKLDILLFGRVRSGPFFALAVKEARRP